MNNKQRIVLIMGAAALLYVLFTSPTVSIVKGTYVTPPADKKDVARIADVSTAMTRAVAVLGATVLVFIALKDKGRQRIRFTEDKTPIGVGCQENEREPVKKDTIAKIIKFLKDFF